MKKLIAVISLLFVLAACSRDDGNISNFNPDPKAGGPATDFLYRDIREVPFRLSEKKGNVVILYFWRMKCEECKEELDSLEALNKKYKDNGLIIAAVNADSMHSAPLGEVLEFIEKHGLTFVNMRDDKGFVTEAYNVLKAPQSFIIDKNGTIHTVGKKSLEWMSPENTLMIEGLIKAP
ncbi:MAG: TlpA disulfide reductase family protein [Deltaproteobacteria bacterium]|nr:TlpA disulfide reductase family protein [Deltaproteobacteria bacterium]